MTISICFWMVYIIIVLFGLYLNYEPGKPLSVGGHLGIMILIGLLGWGVYGPVLHR